MSERPVFRVFVPIMSEDQTLEECLAGAKKLARKRWGITAEPTEIVRRDPVEKIAPLGRYLFLWRLPVESPRHRR
jgi:hypothetical protein